VSLTHEAYEEMVRAMHLPFRAIEGSSVVGPFFWAAFDQDDEDPHLRMAPTPLDFLSNPSVKTPFLTSAHKQQQQKSSFANPTSASAA